MSSTALKPFSVTNSEGAGMCVILCEHASNFNPARFGNLGLSEQELIAHAAWDPRALDLARDLFLALGLPLVVGMISRLVYDCNRPPDSSTAMTRKLEDIEVPGNTDITNEERSARACSVYFPFVDAVNDVIAQRRKIVGEVLALTIHGFSPTWFGVPRDAEIGILHDHDARLANCMLAQAGKIRNSRIRRNSPYGPDDGVTHSLPIYGVRNGLRNFMIEVRNDLLTDRESRTQIPDEILFMLRPCLVTSKCNLHGQVEANS